jgi:hypothetical protein
MVAETAQWVGSFDLICSWTEQLSWGMVQEGSIDVNITNIYNIKSEFVQKEFGERSLTKLITFILNCTM